MTEDRETSTGGYGDGDPGRFTRDEAEEPGERATTSEPEDHADEGADEDGDEDG